MLRLRSSRLARVAGAAALLALIGVPVLAQDDTQETADGLRAGIDANPEGAGPDEAAPPSRDARAVGRIPRYGKPPGSGAGSTGFVSTDVSQPKPKPGTDQPQDTDAGPAPAPGAGPDASAAPRRKKLALRPGKARIRDAPSTPPAKLRAVAGAGAPDGGVARPKPKPPRELVPEADPFAPVGVRLGAFVLRPALELTAGYDSNPARVPGGPGSALLMVAPELNANSDWERHQLTASIRGSYSDYPSVHFADRPLVDTKLDGRIDVSRELRVDLEARYLLSTENPGSPNLQAGLAKLPIYTDVGASAGINRRFNRLDVSLKGAVDRVVYQDSQLTDGTSASNKDRDYNQYGVQARAGYEVTPGLKPFVELDADARVHDLPIDDSGYARDSEGFTPKVGTTFEITRKLTGEIAAGYLVRTYKDPRLSDLHGLIANSSLVWTATGLTTVKLTASSTTGESVLPGVSGLFQRDAGIEVDHAFRRWLLATLKLGCGLDDYVGLDRQDRRYAVSLGLVYKLSRTMQLKTELRELWLRSNVSGADYTATMILVGLRLQR